MDKDTALKLALEALGKIADVNAMDYEYRRWAKEAITALQEALAQPKQEPVEYTGNGTAGREADVRPTAFFFQMPPQRKPLTKEQIRAIAYGDMGTDANEFRDFVLPLARAIEAAHSIKE